MQAALGPRPMQQDPILAQTLSLIMVDVSLCATERSNLVR